MVGRGGGRRGGGGGGGLVDPAVGEVACHPAPHMCGAGGGLQRPGGGLEGPALLCRAREELVNKPRGKTITGSADVTIAVLSRRADAVVDPLFFLEKNGLSARRYSSWERVHQRTEEGALNCFFDTNYDNTQIIDKVSQDPPIGN